MSTASRHLVVMAAGTGGQEALTWCEFIDVNTALAVGRNVNHGPAFLELRRAVSARTAP